MRAIAPRLGLPEVMVAEDQHEYMTVCAAVVRFADGSDGLMTRWRLDDGERARIAAGDDIYLGILTFGRPMQPVSLEVGRPPWAGEAEP